MATGALMLVLASPAYGQGFTLQPDNGGGDQYVAPVPDAGGNRPAGPGGGGNPGSLSPRIRGQLPPGGEGRTLARLATDPGSGAPSDSGLGGVGGSSASGGAAGGGGNGSAGGGDGSGGAQSGADGGFGGSGGGSPAREADGTAASAITSAISDNPSVGVLVAALLALTLATAAVGFARRRRRGF